MSTNEGTTGNGVAVQTQESLLIAMDAQAISDLSAALTAADKAAGIFGLSMAQVAGKVLTLHRLETWKRTIDGETGKLYTSAKAFYASMNRSDRFPALHKIVRTELISELLDGDKLSGIGVNELAALIGCDAAQVTRTVKELAAANRDPEAEAKAAAEAAEAALDEAAAEAEAQAKAEGADDKAAKHAAEVARAEAKAAAEAQAKAAEAEAAEAQAKAEAEAEAKQVTKAIKQLSNAFQAVRDAFALMTYEQALQVVKDSQAFNNEATKFAELIKPVEPQRRGRGRGQRSA